MAGGVNAMAATARMKGRSHPAVLFEIMAALFSSIDGIKIERN